MNWLDLLKKHIQTKGRPAVRKELGLSATTLSLVLAGKYGANTKNIENAVMAAYATGPNCPVLGHITHETCDETFDRAKRLAPYVGNPDTLRLYRACLGDCKERCKC